MDGTTIVGAGFAMMGLYCFVMPGSAKLHIHIGGRSAPNCDWMPDGGVRIMGVALFLLGAAIAKGWLFN